MSDVVAPRRMQRGDTLGIVSPCVDCDSIFHQLKQIGVFNKIRAVVIGYIYSMQTSKEPTTQMEDILLKTTREYDFPILKTNDFDHECPNTVLPVGAKTRIDSTRKQIEILEKCAI